jgi:cytochrome c-type biogenesis protein CcmH|tara:strand:+ start:1122 stop:1490 length:369 start_codon:yes stop_codon:yes gene_type:complete
MRSKVFLFSFLILISTTISYGENSKDTKLYNKIITELRCMVCQNQNIAESEAPLAVDLRNKVKTMINSGYDEKYIKKYMSDRYSDFILYDPPFRVQNILLWIGPFLFLLIIYFILFRKNIIK